MGKTCGRQEAIAISASPRPPQTGRAVALGGQPWRRWPWPRMVGHGRASVVSLYGQHGDRENLW
jgi:hypothetical protein